jgi:phage protein U
MQIGLLGAISFGVHVPGGIVTFHGMSRKHSSRWEDHPIHLHTPSSEYLGPDLVEAQIEMNLNAAWCDPQRAIARLVMYWEQALAMPLVIGGRPFGPGRSLFTVREVDEKHSRWWRRGELIKNDVAVTLKEHRAALRPGILGAIVGGVR